MEEVIIYRIRVIFGQVSQRTFPVSSLRCSIIKNQIAVVWWHMITPNLYFITPSAAKIKITVQEEG